MEDSYFPNREGGLKPSIYTKMKFLSFILSLLFFLNISASAPLAEKEASSADVAKSIEFIRSISLGSGLQDSIEKRLEDDADVEKRDIALLTTFFSLLNDSNLVVPVLKILATNTVTEPLLVKAIIEFLKLSNLEDLLHAVDESGLAVDIVLRALQEEAFLPGAYNIIHGLMNGSSTTPSETTVSVSSLESALSPIASALSSSEFSLLLSVFSEILSDLNLDEIDSGLTTVLSPVLSALNLLGFSSSLSSLASGTLTASATSTGLSTATSGSSSSTTTASTTSSTSTSTSTSSSTASSYISSFVSWAKSLFSKRDVEEVSKRDVEEQAKRDTAAQAKSAAAKVSKRDNAILDSLVESLEKSGLAMSVVDSIITDPDMAPFARDLIKNIVTEEAITLTELSGALNNTNILNDAIIGTISSPDLGISF